MCHKLTVFIRFIPAFRSTHDLFYFNHSQSRDLGLLSIPTAATDFYLSINICVLKCR